METKQTYLPLHCQACLIRLFAALQQKSIACSVIVVNDMKSTYLPLPALTLSVEGSVKPVAKTKSGIPAS